MTRNEMYMKIKRMHFPKQTTKSFMGMLRNMTDKEAENFVKEVCKI